MEKLEETIESLNYVSKNVNKLRKDYLKQLNNDLKVLKNKTKQMDANSYYLRPVKISSTLAQFFKLLPDHEYSRVFCYRKVFEYLKKNQLLTLEEVTISSDVGCLFKVDEVSLMTLHKALEWHFE